MENINNISNEFLDFARWWVTYKPMKSSNDCVHFQDNIVSTLLYREGCFQVQLMTMRPKCTITPHIHPTVNSLILYLNGHLVFQADGTLADSPLFLHDDSQVANGEYLYIPANVSHWAKSGSTGASFLNIEHWLEGEPTFISYNWSDKDDNKVGQCVLSNDRGDL